MKTDDTVKIRNKTGVNTQMLPLDSNSIINTMLLTILASCIVTSNSFCSNHASTIASSYPFKTLPLTSNGEIPFVRLATTKIHSAPPRQRPEDECYKNIYEDSNDKILKSFSNIDKSEESSFWYMEGFGQFILSYIALGMCYGYFSGIFISI